MGEAVGRLADEFVITSDDPRHERADDICAAVAAGAEAAGRRAGEDYEIITDRRQAIREMIRRARPGDTVLLAGKGHEDRLLVGDEVLHYRGVTRGDLGLGMHRPSVPLALLLPLRLWRPRPGTHAPPTASCDPPAHSNRHQRRGLEIFLSWHSSILFAREVQEEPAFCTVPEAARSYKERHDSCQTPSDSRTRS